MISFYQIAISISLLLLIGCEIWVSFKSARGMGKNSFLLLNLSFILFLSGFLWVSLKRTPAPAHLSTLLLTCSIIFTPPLWVFFTSTFAREESKEELKKGLLSFIPFFILSLFFLSWHLRKSLILVDKDLFGEMRFYFAERSQLFLIFLLAGSVVSILNLERTFRSSTETERGKLILPLIFSLALLVLLIYLVTSGFLGAPISNLVLLSRGMLSALWGVSLAWYLKERATSIQITRQVVYSSVIVILIGGYLVLVGLVARLIQSFGANLSVFLSILAAFLVIVILSALVVSGSIKERVKRFVDQSLYRGKVDYKAEWTRFSENIASLLDLEEILKEIVGMISANLRIKNIMILLSESQGDLGLAYPKDSSFDLRIRKEEEFLDWILRYGEPIGIKDLGEDRLSTREISTFFTQVEELEFETCVPMIAKRSLVGLLFLGSKGDNYPFTEEDFSFLNGVAHQSSIAILNAKLSQQLIQAKEMESFNKLSSFILHDLKNFVSMLSLLLQNAEEKLKHPDFQRSAMVTISDTVERMRGLMNKLSSASEGVELNYKSCDLNKILQNLLNKIRVAGSSQIKTALEFSPLPSVRCDQTQLEKVFQNLIINALEAMAGGGILSIHTGLDKESGAIRIKVSDSGAGMSRDFIRNQLFKPFQTTKRKGLGIGLYQCKEIVELHKGRIIVESEEGKGTSFTVELPFKGI